MEGEKFLKWYGHHKIRYSDLASKRPGSLRSSQVGNVLSSCQSVLANAHFVDAASPTASCHFFHIAFLVLHIGCHAIILLAICTLVQRAQH